MGYPRENLGDGLDAQQLTGLITAQNELLNDTIEKLGLKNDAALARATMIPPPIVSKMRRGKAFIHAHYQITLHELTGWSVEAIKKKLGVPTVQERHAAEEKRAKARRLAASSNGIVTAQAA